jgi:hypothetical protein
MRLCSIRSMGAGMNVSNERILLAARIAAPH